MNAERLLELYEQISEAPDAIARLQRFVLDLAVRGKLVEQDAADEPALEALERIAAKKTQLIASKEIKKPRSLPPNDPKQWPFDLPPSWTWARIDELSPHSLTDGDWIESKDQDPDGSVRLIQLADVGVGKFIDKSSRYITNETEVRLNCTRLKAGDVLIARLPNPIGRACVFPNIGQTAITAVDVAILRHDANMARDFSVIALNSAPTRAQIEAYGKGTTRFRVSTGHLKTVLIPVPPLAEQHRIVAKVDELMALCDRLEEARKTREETRDKLTAATLARLTAPEAPVASETDGTNAPSGAAPNHAKPENAETGPLSGTATVQPSDFPTHARFAIETLPALTSRPDQIKSLRQTILNLAVRGKLVEQDPADEPASVQLTRIEVAKAEQNTRKNGRSRGLPRTEEETTTNLPLGWSKVSLADVAISMRYGTSVKCGQDQSQTPVLRIPNVSGGRISLDDMKYGPLKEKEQLDLALNEGDLLMIRSNGSLPIVGRSAVVTKDAFGMSFAGYLVRLRSLPAELSTTYIWMALNSQLVRDQIELPIRSAVGLKNVNLTEFGNLSFWLPPLAEQHRIVAKVDALMALCDRLETALTTADTTRTRLLEALLHEALEPATDIMEAAE